MKDLIQFIRTLQWPAVFVGLVLLTGHEWPAVAVTLALAHRRDLSRVLRHRRITVKTPGFQGSIGEDPGEPEGLGER